MPDPSQDNQVLSSLLDFFKLKLKESLFPSQLGENLVSIASLNFVKHLVCESGKSEQKRDMASREPSNIQVSGSKRSGSHHQCFWLELI